MATTTEESRMEITRQLTDPDAPAPAYNFAFAPFLKKAYRFSPARPVCRAFRETGSCPRGEACPERHAASQAAPTHGTNNLVCKHWLRGLCKKGDACEFLHEYNVRRMPECTHYARSLWCPAGDECLYQHVDPASRRAQCPHYDRGFCPLGPRCAKRHVRRKLCKYYLAGFCPYGRQCKEGAHPRFPTDLPKPTVHVERSPEELEAERQRIREEAEREDELGWQGKDGGARGGRGRRRGFGRGRRQF